MADRQPISAQCYYGKDDDLIAWYLSLEKGTRQDEIKRLLREALGLRHPEDSTTVTISMVREIINQELDDFAEENKLWVMNQLSQLATVSVNGEQTVPMSVVKKTLDEATAEMRLKNIKKDTW